MQMSRVEEHDLKLFAAAALQGLLAGLGRDRHRLPAETAVEAWKLAKAMIETAPVPIKYAYGHGQYVESKNPPVNTPKSFDYGKGNPDA